jgi:hypothetical protein
MAAACIRPMRPGGPPTSSRIPRATALPMIPNRCHPCIECSLMEFVPPRFQANFGLCRFLPLTEIRETVDHFYGSGTQMELEGAFAYWLRSRIGRQNIAETPPPIVKPHGSGSMLIPWGTLTIAHPIPSLDHAF